MVSFSSFFRKIFASRKQSRQTESSPPPYDDQEIPDEATLTDEKLSHLLNPDLKFTAEEIESQLVKKDAAFASAVVELMLPRLRLGVWQEPVGWGHYSYTLDKHKEAGCHSEACQCNKATGWDSIIGFKAWDYSSRFTHVAKLVKRDLEYRGFAVDKVEVYTHKCSLKNCRGGVFVKWDIRFPEKNEEKEVINPY